MYGAVQVPWTCPPIISGFYHRWLENSLVANTYFVMSFFVYYPFIKQINKLYKLKYKKQADLEDEDW